MCVDMIHETTLNSNRFHVWVFLGWDAASSSARRAAEARRFRGETQILKPLTLKLVVLLQEDVKSMHHKEIHTKEERNIYIYFGLFDNPYTIPLSGVLALAHIRQIGPYYWQLLRPLQYFETRASRYLKVNAVTAPPAAIATSFSGLASFSAVP